MPKIQDLAHSGQNEGPVSTFDDFRGFFDRYYWPVVHFFANRGFTTEECRDLAQETFLAAYTSRDRFRGDSKIETWLFSIALNIWRNVLRHRGRRKRAGEEISLEEDFPSLEPELSGVASAQEPEALWRMLRNERVELVRKALLELPELMRTCTLMRLDQDLKYEEIAVVLRIPVDMVKSQLFQARSKLKERLAGYYSDIEL